VHDKVVRRRRAVLGLLVFICLVLLTAYFGESQSSPLHSVQRGIVAVVSPIQDGASKVLSPVRNVSDWVSSTLRAKTQNGQLRRTNQQLSARITTLQQAEIDNRQLQREVKLDQNIGAADYRPVGASVIVRDPNIWYQQVVVNAGSSDGIKPGDPVLGDGALVGKVSEVTGSSAVVVLITDHTVSVAAEAQHVPTGNAAPSGTTGVLSPAVGNPDELELQDLPHNTPVSEGDFVVTAGYQDPSNPSLPGSLYPPGIPIGRVSSFSQNDLLNTGQVPVEPLASMRRFTAVQILTKPYSATTEASVN
jgi:rod shape-determining protein MreC